MTFAKDTMKYWHPHLPFVQHISVSTLVLLEYKRQINKYKLSSTHISHTVRIHLSILCRVGNIRCNHEQNQNSHNQEKEMDQGYSFNINSLVSWEKFKCMLCRSLFFLLYFSFGHCFVYFSSIYGFWLPLWYLQTLLNIWKQIICS